VRDAIRSAMDAVEYFSDALITVIRGEKVASKALADMESAK